MLISDDEKIDHLLLLGDLEGGKGVLNVQTHCFYILQRKKSEIPARACQALYKRQKKTDWETIEFEIVHCFISTHLCALLK